MARDANVTRRKILSAAYARFRKTGYSRTTMDEIADAASLTKRTLYAHFDCKDALLEAVMEAQSSTLFEDKQTFGLELSGSPLEMVQTLFDALAEWVGKGNFAGAGFTRVVMELADLPGHPARRIARRHKAAIEARLAERFLKAGIRKADEAAREIWVLVEGAMATVLIHGDRAYIKTAAAVGREIISRRMQ